jgi:hypothetical protein
MKQRRCLGVPRLAATRNSHGFQKKDKIEQQADSQQGTQDSQPNAVGFVEGDFHGVRFVLLPFS